MDKNRIALYVVKGLIAIFTLSMLVLFGWFIINVIKERYM